MTLKLYYFLIRIYSNAILKSKRQLFELFKIKLSRIFLEKYKNKKASYVNKLALVISIYLLDERKVKDFEDFFLKENEVIQKEIELILGNEDFKKIIADYFVLCSFYYSQGFVTERLRTLSEESFEKASKYDNNAQSLTTKTFSIKNKEIRKNYKREKNQYVKQLKMFINNDVYNVFPKIDVTPEQISFFIGIATTIFILTGYIYNKFFLGFYGIDVSNFFSIGDYLSASIDKISISFLSAVSLIVFYIIGMYEAFKNDIIDIQFDVRSKKPHFDIYIAVVIVMIVLLSISILLFYYDMPEKYNFLRILILLVVISLFHKLPIDRFFNKGIYISIFLVVVFIFSIFISGAIMNDIDRINRSGLNELKKYKFTFNQELAFDKDSCFLLSRNSEYLFFYNKQLKKTYIVPNNLVKYVETTKK